MGLARYERVITDEFGNVVPLAQVQVRREVAGLPLVSLFLDADGTQAAGNPITADADGKVAFHVAGWRDGYRVRAYLGGFEDVRFNVPIGNAAYVDTDQLGVGSNTDKQVDTIADRAAYDGEAEDFSVLVSDIGDGRAAIYSKNSASSGDWSDPAIVTGPAGVGTGLSFDVVVDNLTERALYDDEIEGYTVLVSDSGDGRAAIYVKVSDASADWSDPSYIVGDRVDIVVEVPDFPYSGEQLRRHIFTNPVNFPAGLVGSQANAEGFSTGTAVFSIEKNGVEIGTVTFDNSVDGDFALTGGASFDAGDILLIIAPAPQDATLYNVSITLAGTRSPAP